MNPDPVADALVLSMVLIWITVSYILFFYAPWIPSWQRGILSGGVALIGVLVVLLLRVLGIL